MGTTTYKPEEERLASALRYLVNRCGNKTTMKKVHIAPASQKHGDVLVKHGYLSKTNPENPQFTEKMRKRFYITDQGREIVEAAKALKAI